MASISSIFLCLAVVHLFSSETVFGSDEKGKQVPTYHIRENSVLMCSDCTVYVYAGTSGKAMTKKGRYQELEEAEEEEAEEKRDSSDTRRYEEPSPLMDFQATLLVFVGLGLFLLGFCMGCLLTSFLFYLADMRNRHRMLQNLYFLGVQKQILCRGNMPNMKKLSPLLVLYIACILLVVGVTTNSWATAGAGASGKEGSLKDEEYRGLFKQCGGLGAQSKLLDYSGGACAKADDQKEVKTLVVGGLFAACVVTAMMIFYAFLKHSKDSYKIMPKVCGIAGAVAAVAILLGLAVFGIIFLLKPLFPLMATRST